MPDRFCVPENIRESTMSLSLLMMLAFAGNGVVRGIMVDHVIDVINANCFTPLTVTTTSKEERIKDIVGYISHNVVKGGHEAKKLVVASYDDALEEVLPLLVNEKHQMSVLLLVGKIDNLEGFKGNLSTKLKSLEEGFYFYLALESSVGMIWQYAFGIQRMHNPIIGHVHVKDNFMMKEDYNLQGMHIKSITLNWDPYFVARCDDNGKNCESIGYLSELTNLLGQKLNFTWESHNEPDNNWGVVAVSGPSNGSGTFEGVVGSLLEADEYQFSISSWVYVVERIEMFEFVHVLTDSRVLAMIPRRPDVDYGLFIRPFHLESWIAIGSFLALLFAILAIIRFSLKDSQLILFTRAFKTVGWLFFLFINVYYSGVLTMFFTTTPSVPFKSINEVMQAHPEWILKHPFGYDAAFIYNSDPDYVSYWKLVQNDIDKYTCKDVEECMAELNGDKTVIYLNKRQYQDYANKNPWINGKAGLFAKQRTTYNSIVTPKDSPLAIVLQQGYIDLDHSGQIDYLNKKYFGAEGNRRTFSSIPDSLTNLSAGQVILIFIMMMVVVGIVLCLLVLEIIWKRNRLMRNKNSHVIPTLIREYKNGKKITN